MTQVTRDRPPDEARDLLNHAIREMPISTLREIRRAVDEYEEEERLRARHSRRMLIAGLAAVAAMAVILYLSGGALPRLLTGLLGQ